MNINKGISLIFLLISLLQVLTGYSQKQAEEITGKFFQLYQEKSSDEAIDYVFSTNKWLSAEQTNIANIKTQLKKGLQLIGTYYGYELIQKKFLSESYVLMSYLLKYERQPVKFTFILYKPDSVWQVQNMKFDDKLEDDIEGAK